jgi:hypothetical protein
MVIIQQAMARCQWPVTYGDALDCAESKDKVNATQPEENGCV